MPVGSRFVPRRAIVVWRMAWTVASLVAVQTVVCGVSAAPVMLVWQWLDSVAGSNPIARWALFSVAIVPSYVLFAVSLMIVSPFTMRLHGVEIGSDSQVGALSFVPKHAKLKGGFVYAGIPAMPIEEEVSARPRAQGRARPS